MTPALRLCFALMALPFLRAGAEALPPGMRVAASGGVYRLETAAICFAPPPELRATHPLIWAVGVAHIGDAAYYRSLQAFLNARSCVFFEMLNPQTVTHQQRHDQMIRTWMGLRFFAQRCADYHAAHGVWPLTQEALHALLPEGARAADRKALLADAAGNPWRALPLQNGSLFIQGGGGALTVSPGGRVTGFADGGLGELQQAFARALGLAWQLAEINYNYPAFTNVDTSMESVVAALQKALADDEALTGSSDIGGAFFLALLSGGDSPVITRALACFERACRRRAVREACRYVLLAALSNSAAWEEQMLPGMAQALLHERNRAVIHTLNARLPEFKANDSIALFYGAGHTEGLARHLLEMGYTPTTARYSPAFQADSAAIPAFRLFDRLLKEVLPAQEEK